MLSAFLGQVANSPSYTPGELAAFLGITVFLLGGYLLARKAIVPEPPLHKEYITRTEVEKIEKNLKDDLSKQAGARKDIHRDIETLRIGQARLETETATQTRQLLLLDGKIEDLPEKIIRLIERRNP
jgi:hypothetical protein